MAGIRQRMLEALVDGLAFMEEEVKTFWALGGDEFIAWWSSLSQEDKAGVLATLDDPGRCPSVFGPMPREMVGPGEGGEGYKLAPELNIETLISQPCACHRQDLSGRARKAMELGQRGPCHDRLIHEFNQMADVITSERYSQGPHRDMIAFLLEKELVERKFGPNAVWVPALAGSGEACLFEIKDWSKVSDATRSASVPADNYALWVERRVAFYNVFCMLINKFTLATGKEHVPRANELQSDGFKEQDHVIQVRLSSLV